MAPLDLRLLAGEVSDTPRRELPNRQWTRRMVALTRNFDVLTSRVTASFSAVFFSAGYIAKIRHVRALFGLLIRHYNSVLSNSVRLLRLTEALQLLTWRRSLHRPRCFEGILLAVRFRQLRHFE
jgi:hypothetical protein